MRVYCVEWREVDQGSCLEWHTNKADANRRARELRADPDIGDATVRPQAVPVTRRDLVQWLNRHLNRDNG